MSHLQQVLDVEGRLTVAKGQVALPHPLFLKSDQRIIGEGRDCELNCETAGVGFVPGWKRGLIGDEHFTPQGFRTFGRAYPVGFGDEYQLGPVGVGGSAHGWKQCTRLKIRATFTKHWNGEWAPGRVVPLGGINSMGEGPWGPIPSPFVLYVYENTVVLYIRDSNGATAQYIQTINPTDATINVDFDVQIPAGLWPNHNWVFALCRTPFMPAAGGYWGAEGPILDMTINEFKMTQNQREISVIMQRVPTYEGGPSLPILRTNGGWTRGLYIWTAGSDERAETIELKDFELVGGAASPLILVGRVQGGNGLSLENVSLTKGMRSIQSAGIFVHYPLTLEDCLLKYANDTALWLFRASGVETNRTSFDYARRCYAHTLACQAEFDGPRMMAVPGPPAGDCAFMQEGGVVKYSQLIANYEGFGPDAFLHLRPATFDLWTDKTVATLEECHAGHMSPNAVRVLRKQYNYNPDPVSGVTHYIHASGDYSNMTTISIDAD